MQQLADHLHAYSFWSAADLAVVLRCFEPVEVPADGFLLRAGRECAYYYFVEQGCCRIFYEAAERAITGWLAFEGDFFTELASFRAQQPSRFSIQALEPMRVLRLPRAAHETLLRTLPAWQHVVREVWETAFLRIVDGILSFQTLTAAERYAALLQQHPQAHNVPLKHLASFLGITPTSLSRLRAQK